jgi:hypothetical protein
MANGTVKLPGIGPVKTQWVWVGGALVVGIVGYAYWNRQRTIAAQTPLTDAELEALVPQDREPPATVVGAQNFDTLGAGQVISTNTGWFQAAIDYLVN